MKIEKELLTRAVSTFIDPGNEFEKKLEAKARGEYKEDIIIKLGIDPTRPDIHIGHAVILRKLRAFQDIGCKVIFLIGDYTALIGDPTGKSKVRPEISQKEVEANMKTYLDQVGKILSTEPEVFSWIRNSDWFLDVTDIQAEPGLSVDINDVGGKNHITVDANSFVGKAALYENTRMQKTHLGKNITHTVSLSRVIATLRGITHARLIERDMFKERIEGGKELYMHEMLYPVLQGIDSSVLAHIYGTCDLEIGGSDQTFNMLIGRDVMKLNEQKEQAVMALEILEGLDGKEKMSKSLDNYVSIVDSPEDMYGKIMSIPDTKVTHYFLLTTYTPEDEIASIEEKLEKGDLHPKDVKMRLAREITAIYHGESAAKSAEESFNSTFSKGEIPADAPKISVSVNTSIVEALTVSGLVESKSDARRLISQGAVTHLEDDRKVGDADEIAKDGTYRIGKFRFLKLEVK